MKQKGNVPTTLTVYKCYRSILAVTFTNKATEEMKARILSQLYGIWKQLPSSASYLKKVCEDMDISANLAAHRAGMALTQLIHHKRMNLLSTPAIRIHRNLTICFQTSLAVERISCTLILQHMRQTANRTFLTAISHPFG